MAKQNAQFVEWFRQSSPYIHAHRGKVLVVSFDGEAITDSDFAYLMYDVALLNGLGMKLVLVPGARPQIEERLALRGAKIQLHNGLRITDEQALQCVKDAAGNVRVEIEALLSMGLNNSPMAGTAIRVASGNHVTAKPIGIVDGVDYLHTGEVRKVNADAIRAQLDANSVVLVPPLGYSPTGEAFNLSAPDVASAVAIALHADKLIYLTEGKLKLPANMNSLVTKEVDAVLARRKSLSEDQRRLLANAAAACRAGVKRTHILNRLDDGAILSELFTREGSGLLVTQEPFEQTRPANIDDVGGILELIEPLEASGALVKRSREKLEQEINCFTVIECDGSIIACAALYPFEKESTAEVACFVVSPNYQGTGRGESLLNHIEADAKQQKLESIFVLSTRTSHWFREQGFVPSDVSALPKRKRDLYNWQRKSRVFSKKL